MTSNAILFLHALSGLHPGSGTALGVVDLPVQRERHTSWPTIPGSSVKGVLRDSVRRAGADQTMLSTLFGPETADADRHAGALAVSDARLLAFPVRSLSGVFAWTTCPAAWARLARDAAMAGQQAPAAPTGMSEGMIALADGSPLKAGADVVLEEFAFHPEGSCTLMADWLARNAIADAPTAAHFKTRLAVIPDDDFTHFVRHATEVTARIGLDYKTKTVRKGALFYEEFLPPETLFYVLIFSDNSRNSDLRFTGKEVLAALESNLPPVIQLGAGETIGKGFCATRLTTSGEVAR